ncbi:TonB-dependent receptor [Sphingomonas quercus]|uniref:TonB-dependent receptor n=1 Tax=Sphingomonas quercus TaxID=2842451 RepID=A0ABS6BIF2_9SPHN|nr:TonB-dependent receptor [Sphingomonas quercus]MBU3077377.1 TonB-dependent receptor [Sphingomonas quercus]
MADWTAKNPSGRRIALVGATSMLALAVAAPAFAQAQPAPGGDNGAPQDEIVVTGLRGSLQRNLDIKRSAPGVVDAISAEDIGKFPDSNVAASLQRLPGVSIQRAGARGEATGITVRGFGGDFNETLYDGRRVSTATGQRSVDFSTIGADFVGQLNLLKTPDVTIAANSIGATVNIMFPKPFDHPGLRLSASASGSWQEDAKKVVPTGGLLFSDTFADDTFGILADVVYTRHDTQANNVYINGFNFSTYAPCQLAGSTAASCNPSDTSATASDRRSVIGAFPQQYGAQQVYTKDERIDGRVAVQWHPTDEVMVTLDDNYSRQQVRSHSFGYGVWFNQGSLRNVQLDSNGVPTNFSQAGSQTDFVANDTDNVLETNQTGLNVKWDVSDNFSVEADGNYSKSWRNPGGRINDDNADVGYGYAIGPNLGVKIDGNSDDTLPVLVNYGAGGNPARFADTSVFGSHVMVRQANKTTDQIKQGRLAAQWKDDKFSIKFGGQYLEEVYRNQTSNTFANNFWQAYSGYGPDSATNPNSVAGVRLPSSLFANTVGVGGFMPGFAGALAGPLINYSVADVRNYLSGLGNPQTKQIPGFNYADGQVGPNFTGNFDLALDPASVQRIQERTWALFVRASFETEIAGMPLFFNAGMREEHTNIASSGVGRQPLTLTTSEADRTLLNVTYTPTQPITVKSSYSYLLPSLDMKLNVTDTFDLRFDASRTLTRPNLGFLSPVLNVGQLQRIGALTATGNNPELRPYLSDNFDVAAEWYYKRNSYIAVDFFLKNVSNFIVAGTTRQTVNGVVDPTTGQLANFAVSARVNGPEATVRGVEIAWQHVFGDSGFGFQANATLVNTNKPYDKADFSTSGFAVTGLANSANAVAFYDKNGFQIRAALNWRDEYLLQFGQAQNTGSFGAEPTFVNAATQVDLSSSWDITNRISVFGEVLNITNETYSTHGRFKNQLLTVFNYGRRVTVGARFRL